MSAIVWYAKQVMDKVEAQVQQNMDKAAILLQGEIVKSFGSPPSMPEGWKPSRSKKSAEKIWRGKHHSTPGSPPFVQLGHLWRSITWSSANKLTRLVGSSLKPDGILPGGKPSGDGKHSYAWYLEYGTSKMAARPYLLPALRRLRGQLFRIIATGN